MKFKPIHYILIVLAALLVIGGLTVAVILSMNKEPEPCLHPNLGAYEHSEIQHWKVCPDCQEQLELAEHAYVENVCVCGLTDPSYVPEPEFIYGLYDGDELKISWADLVSNKYINELGQIQAGYELDLAGILYIDKSITQIPTDAFNGCTLLTNVVLHDEVISIGDRSFKGCESITTIDIPSNVTNIGVEAFANSGINNIAIPNTVSAIGYGAFKNTKIESIEIPEGIKTIGANTFMGCTQLKSVKTGMLEEIGPNAFDGCIELSTFIFPDSLNMIGYDAFRDCNKILEVSNGITYAGNWVISADKNIVNANIKSTAVGILGSAFSHCKELITVVLPESIKYIGDDAFTGCSSLTSINIPSSLTEIRYNTFGNCTSLTSIVIPANIKTIGSCAFYYCENLTSINIADGVEKIGSYAFQGCKSLTTVVFPDSVVEFGFASEQDREESTWFGGCLELTTVKLGTGIKLMPENAFVGCSKLVNIEMFGIEEIGNYAFRDCISLTEIALSPNLKRIGNEAFGNCINLEYVEIPEGTEHIGKFAFLGCSKITRILIPKTIKVIEQWPFAYIDKDIVVEYSGTVNEWKSIEGFSNVQEVDIICSDGIYRWHHV